MQRVVVVDWCVHARDAEAAEDPVVAEAIVVVSVMLVVGCVVWEVLSGCSWIVVGVDGVESRDVLSLTAMVLRWVGGVVGLGLLLLLVVLLVGEIVSAVWVELGGMRVSSVNLARFPLGVADLTSDDLVFPRDERRDVDEVLADDHISVRVRGVFEFFCDLVDVGGVGLESSTSISSVLAERGTHCGDIVMSSALRTSED